MLYSPSSRARGANTCAPPQPQCTGTLGALEHVACCAPFFTLARPVSGDAGRGAASLAAAHLQRFVGNFLLLVGRHGAQGAHVVQPIRQLHYDDPHLRSRDHTAFMSGQCGQRSRTMRHWPWTRHVLVCLSPSPKLLGAVQRLVTTAAAMSYCSRSERLRGPFTPLRS